MLTAYTSVWNLATIFDDGKYLADFMSRWNRGIVIVNYYPFDEIRKEIWWTLGWLFFYFASLITCFIYNWVPAVRGMSDVLGVFLLRPFMIDVRISEHFYLVRIFGLAFHLYAVYASRSLTLLVLLYCKFLENLARKWNLRFCYRFGMRKFRLIF
jgi:hypothetical protein